MAHVVKQRVAETTDSLGGDGIFALDGAVAKYLPASARMAIGDTADFMIVGAADWEHMKCEYSAADELARVETFESSDGDAPVTFAAGTKTIFMWPRSSVYLPARELLPAGRDYYVRTDGNDANTGLVDSPGGAFATLGKVCDVIAGLDSTYAFVQVFVADGTYNDSIFLTGQPFSLSSGESGIYFIGNAVSPGNVIVNGGATIGDGRCYLQGFDFKGSVVADRSFVSILDCSFSGNSTYRIRAKHGARVTMESAISLSGNLAAFVYAQYGGVVSCSSEVQISGAPNFTVAYVSAEAMSYVEFDGGYSGAATGSRYSSIGGSVVNSNGGGASAFPGNAAGSVGTGGVYV